MVSNFNEIEFIGKVEQYIGTNLKYEISNHVIKMYIDNEIYYTFDCNNMNIYMYERGTKIELSHFETEKLVKANFAMLIRNSLNNGNNYINPEEIEKCSNLEELKLVCKNNLDEHYYSIGTVQIGKISIIFDGEYEILLGTANKNYSIVRDSDKEYIFSRFHNEVIYYVSFLKNLKDYEVIFNEKFSEEEIMKLGGININEFKFRKSRNQRNIV